ncbi:MAG TPA: acylneuraminate cytidylyltransferase family protein [Cytophagaceae bacterium]|jgi:CMP-N,N'-diacetyllegionaminic acid synthase|nr:acylneuraminate cytidylyltransferase family protein [Cytophagaceae bacterium]
MRTLYLIPARGGSKGIPNKNIKNFDGKPLLFYSIDVARQFSEDKDICVSSDDDNIISAVQKYGLNVPFIRPAEFATDHATGYDVILHAIQYYENHGIYYDRIVLLQPTSPLRKINHIKESLQLYNQDLEMVVSVEEIYDPVYLCYKENEKGYLKKIKENDFGRRQDMPKVYKYNGAIYIINVKALKQINMSNFTKIKKYIMDDISSIDIDTFLEWEIAEFLHKKNSML